MKLAAAHAIAQLARESVPDRVRAAYGGAALRFGVDYILPKPVDERVLLWVAPAVAKAAMETGVARRPIDLSTYRDALEQRLGPSRSIVRQVIYRVAHDPKRIVFAKADDPRVLRALEVMVEDGIAKPVVLGDERAIRAQAEELDVKLAGVEFVALGDAPPRSKHEEKALLALRGRRCGMTAPRARTLLMTDATVAGLDDGATWASPTWARRRAPARLPGDDSPRASARRPQATGAARQQASTSSSRSEAPSSSPTRR